MAKNEYAYIKAMQDHFTASTKGVTHLFKVNVSPDDLWEMYLQGFPAEERQHYNCNACKSFIRKYGNVVTIDTQGRVSSPLWSAPVDSEHVGAFRLVESILLGASVSGVFYDSETIWGTPVNRDNVRKVNWEHLSVKPAGALVFRSRTETAGQAMAKKREEFQGIQRAITEFSKEVAQQALALATSGALRRGDLVRASLEWFIATQDAMRSAKGSAVAKLWLIVSTAPAGFCFIRSSLAGTLMQDIAEGRSAAEVKRRYEEKADPTNYQRAQVAPRAGNIAQAEDLVEKLGLATALERRYASVDELPLFWRSQKLAVEQKVAKGPVFGHLTPKVKEAESGGLEIPRTTMTWEKFRRTVLPAATAIEVLVPDSTQRFAGLVTAAHSDAAPILQWDRPEQRNPFSWYYADGVDASIRKRVMEAGGQVDNVDIRASLSWNTYTDLDLHCHGPAGVIYFGNKRDWYGGGLDVDMNIRPDTLKPVENIRWPKGSAPDGQYEFRVHNYTSRAEANPFQVELELFGEVYLVGGVAPTRSAYYSVASFTVKNGAVVGKPILHLPQKAASNAVTTWGLTPRSWARVQGLCLSPNLWSEEDAERARSGKHVFFLLEGCQDNNKGTGRGFFSEFLVNDLKPVRATLEAYTANADLHQAPDDNPACGLGMSDASEWNLTVRVQTPAGSRLVLIDRWD